MKMIKRPSNEVKLIYCQVMLSAVCPLCVMLWIKRNLMA